MLRSNTTFLFLFLESISRVWTIYWNIYFLSGKKEKSYNWHQLSLAQVRRRIILRVRRRLCDTNLPSREVLIGWCFSQTIRWVIRKYTYNSVNLIIIIILLRTILWFQVFLPNISKSYSIVWKEHMAHRIRRLVGRCFWVKSFGDLRFKVLYTTREERHNS